MNPLRFETFAALRHRNFRLFYAGQSVSLLGSWMQSVALSWLVLVLTDSSFYLGLVGALQALPILLFSFWGGIVADHRSKYHILFLTQGSMMVLAAVLGLLVAWQALPIWALCALVFLAGTAMAFDIPARQAFIVDLVGKPDLPNAIALNSTLFNGTRVLGPALAGLLIAAVGMANCFFLNAVSFLAVLLALAGMELPAATPQPRPGFRQALRELADFLHQRRELRLILFLMTAVSMLGHSYFVLLPMLARDVLKAGPQGFGLLMAMNGVGAFAGGLALARRVRHRPPMPSLMGGLALFLTGLLALSLITTYWLALAAIFFMGFGMVTQLSTSNSLLQLNVPDSLRGRIMSLFSLIIIGSIPLGSLLYGTVAHYLGPGRAMTLGSLAAGMVTILILVRHPRLMQLEFAELPARPAAAPPPGFPGTRR
jgi:MFS family permease|uniref:MFS transporter n=1 Tax=Desulfobacca acetoxidans TaxID=60893 RepID=A0A7C3WS39_9BACT